MLRFITPIILIGIAVTCFFTFTKPMYDDIATLRGQAAQDNQGLDSSKVLENDRDTLTKKYNAFDPNDLAKLQTMVPDNVDNIRLILEVEKIAAPYGMVLKNVKYDTSAATASSTDTATQAAVTGPGIGTAPVGGATPTGGQNYGTITLGFSTDGTYNNFLNFLKDLEKNLRIVDISSVDFSSDTSSSNPSLASIYTYNFTIKTYWLKN